MHKLKRLIIAMFVAGTSALHAQHSIAIEGTKLLTTLQFETKAGKDMSSEYQWEPNGGWQIRYQFTHKLGIQGGLSLGTHSAGSSLTYDSTKYTWTLEYADMSLDIGYIYSKFLVKPYVTISPYFSYLFSGEQVLNNTHIDINESESMNNKDFGIGASLGAQYMFINKLSLYAEFSYLHGILNIEKGKGQTATNRSLGLTIGANFSL